MTTHDLAEAERLCTHVGLQTRDSAVGVQPVGLAHAYLEPIGAVPLAAVMA